MKVLIKIVVVVGILVLMGCGGGGGSPVSVDKPEAEAYQNKKLPTIKKNTIPENLLADKDTGKKIKQIVEMSYGYPQLKQAALSFYGMQIGMNRNLSYMDSVWDQVTEYCEDNLSCLIPDGKIIFTYTEALYKNDLKFIKGYEEKTGDLDTYSTFEQLAKPLIGLSAGLIGMQLLISEEDAYKYTLISKVPSMDGIVDAYEMVTLKWNDDNTKYLVRSDFSNNKYSQFVYRSTDGGAVNTFSTNMSLNDTEILEFIEKDGEIQFVENISGIVSYHSEGKLDDNGGEMTFSDSQGSYRYETFDAQGMVLTSINCLNVIKDKNNIQSDSFCAVRDASIVKNLIVKNIYTLSTPFWDVENINPESSPEVYSMVGFEENNTMKAVVNCSEYTANYEVYDYGIKFSKVTRKKIEDAQCVYSYTEDFFEVFLEKGHSFGNSADEAYTYSLYFNTAFGLWPNFNAVDRSDFNETLFYQKLHSRKYVDSSLINNLFAVDSASEIYNKATDKLFYLSTTPSIRISEEGEIVIEILDANFTADITIEDPTHIRFAHIVRIDKSNVVYPENVQCDNQSGPDVCLDDPYIDSDYSDKVFADIVEAFLNERIELACVTTDCSQIHFRGSKLRFTGLVTD